MGFKSVERQGVYFLIRQFPEDSGLKVLLATIRGNGKLAQCYVYSPEVLHSLLKYFTGYCLSNIYD